MFLMLFVASYVNLILYTLFLHPTSAGLYPEIPEGSQLDFSALKEEVQLLFSALFYQSCH